MQKRAGTCHLDITPRRPRDSALRRKPFPHCALHRFRMGLSSRRPRVLAPLPIPYPPGSAARLWTSPPPRRPVRAVPVCRPPGHGKVASSRGRASEPWTGPTCPDGKSVSRRSGGLEREGRGPQKWPLSTAAGGVARRLSGDASRAEALCRGRAEAPGSSRRRSHAAPRSRPRPSHGRHGASRTGARVALVRLAASGGRASSGPPPRGSCWTSDPPGRPEPAWRGAGTQQPPGGLPRGRRRCSSCRRLR